MYLDAQGENSLYVICRIYLIELSITLFFPKFDDIKWVFKYDNFARFVARFEQLLNIGSLEVIFGLE